MNGAEKTRQRKQADKTAKVVASSFDKAVQAHQAGKLADAEATYRQILDLDPEHADANHLLGLIAHQMGDNETAVELINRAIRVSPGVAAYYCNLGNALHELGRLDEAAASQRQAITLNSEYAMAHNNLANVLLAQGRFDDAAASYRKAIELNPDNLIAFLQLGDILNGKGRLEEAADSYRKALALDPNNPEAHANLGNILASLSRPEDAIASYQQAIALKPDLAEAHNNLGIVLYAQGLVEAAVASHQQAIALNPDYADAHTNLGNALKGLGRLDEAVECHEQAIALKPDLADAYSNLGSVRQEQGRLEEGEAACRHAIELNPQCFEAYANLGSIIYYQDCLEEGEAACRRAIELKPEYAMGHLNLALFLFRKGHLKEAWDEYEWRWQTPKYALPARAYPQPRWDGSPLAGKSILLWGEQGIGDVIRLAGMIPDVLGTGARVSIVCDERLVDIFARSFAGARVFAAPITEAGAEMDAGADEYDFQCPLGSLGNFFRPELDSFPSGEDGYLKTDPQRLKYWKNKLLEISDRPKVGLAWRGSLSDPWRDRENATIEEMAPILSIGGLDFINLHNHDTSADIEQAKSLYGADIHTLDDLDLRNDLDGLAAMTVALDMVISFTTFGAEFAGALGVPTVCFSLRAWAETCSYDSTGKSAWQPAIRYLTRNQTEPWQSVLEEIAEIAKKKLALIREQSESVHKERENNPASKLMELIQEGIRKHQAGQFAEAEAVYRQILKSDPDHADANHLLGLIARQSGNNETAVELISKAIQENPGKASFHNNLGNAMKDLGRLDDAVVSYQNAISLNPDEAKTLGNLGRTLLLMERLQDSVECHEKALALAPDDAEAHVDLGLALHEMDRLDETLASYDKALSLNPDYAEAHNNRGRTLQELDRLDEATACYQTAIKLKPEYSEAHSNLGHLQLLMDDYNNGWKETNWRWSVEEFKTPERHYDKPLWDGAPIEGKRLLVWSEQGIGDEILFSSMIPDLIERGSAIFLESDARLVPLFARSFPEVTCIPKGDTVAREQIFDFHIPCGGLGQVLRGSLDAFPEPAPYLIPDPQQKELLRSRYRTLGQGPLIGIAWRSTSPNAGKLSSLTLQDLIPLFKTPNATFIDLQYGDTEKERAAFTNETGFEIAHDDNIDQFADLDAFAAQVAAMDMVVSIESSTPLIAGALGVPTWVLLRTAPFWCWGLAREDTLWHASLRMFRQKQRGDWGEVIQRVSEKLAKYSFPKS